MLFNRASAAVREAPADLSDFADFADVADTASTRAWGRDAGGASVNVGEAAASARPYRAPLPTSNVVRDVVRYSPTQEARERYWSLQPADSDWDAVDPIIGMGSSVY